MLRTHFVNELGASLAGKEVKVAGWVHEVRELGGLTFLLLRDSTGIVQITGSKKVSKEIVKSLSLPKESVVSITGTVTANKEARNGFEIIPKSVVNLNPLSSKIPFEVTGKVPAELPVRLNYRYIDLRRQQSTAIFKIQSAILKAFREFFTDKKFIEIRTPSIVREATEGGSDLFKIDYFEEDAYLSQSPQLYKQLAIIGGLDRVFMVVPVFRAEKSNTTYHLAESTQMDIEVGFADHNEAIRLLADALVHIIKSIQKENVQDLKILGIENLAVPSVKIMNYVDVIPALNSKGSVMMFGDDLVKEDEKLVSQIYGDAVIIKEYPRQVRAFYSMPNEKNPEIANAFDLIYKGIEVCSGAQRIHLPELLKESIKRNGMDPESFSFYINAFRCGAPPHAGWSIGLERLTMAITNSDNIRECSMFPRDRFRLTP